MSLLSYSQLCLLVDNKVVENSSYDYINSTSIDITLGQRIKYEASPVDDPRLYHTIDVAARNGLHLEEFNLGDEGWFTLRPGQFILAHSEQIFNLPNWLSAEYKLKSSLARVGLEHLNAGWCDAGWNGSVLTLELKNMTQRHNLIIKRGMRIGQVVFFKHEDVPNSKSYAKRGRYNGDKTVFGVKE